MNNMAGQVMGMSGKKSRGGMSAAQQKQTSEHMRKMGL